MEENILIEKAKGGDENALNLLMSNYKKLVEKISRKYFIIGADLKDVIQEGMIGLFNAYLNFDSERNTQFKTFATVCINRQIISAIKKAYKNSLVEFLNNADIEEINFNKNTISPEENFIIKEEYNLLKKEIKEKLSPLEQKILSEFLLNATYDEISKKLDISKKSVDNALTRIRTKLNYLKK